jgi:hypothetical protein
MKHIEINGVRHDFDDMKIVKELLEQLGKIISHRLVFKN